MHTKTSPGPFNGRHAGAGAHDDSPGLESSAQLGGHAGVSTRQDLRTRLDQKHVDTEIGQDRCDLTSRVRCSHHCDLSRKRTQGTEVVVAQGQFRPGDRECRGTPADGNDDPISPPLAPVSPVNGVRIAELHRPQMLEELDPLSSDIVGNSLLVVGVAGHPVTVAQHRREVGLRWFPTQAEALPR